MESDSKICFLYSEDREEEKEKHKPQRAFYESHSAHPFVRLFGVSLSLDPKMSLGEHAQHTAGMQTQCGGHDSTWWANIIINDSPPCQQTLKWHEIDELLHGDWVANNSADGLCDFPAKIK